jgi:hypothetical protein
LRSFWWVGGRASDLLAEDRLAFGDPQLGEATLVFAIAGETFVTRPWVC